MKPLPIRPAALALSLALAFFLTPSITTPLLAEDTEEQSPSAGEVTPYAHKSSKGKTYYLFSREQPLKNSDKVVVMYYFASDPKNKKGTPVAAVPEDREVSETKTGLLVLKKKK